MTEIDAVRRFKPTILFLKKLAEFDRKTFSFLLRLGNLNLNFLFFCLLSIDSDSLWRNLLVKFDEKQRWEMPNFNFGFPKNHHSRHQRLADDKPNSKRSSGLDFSDSRPANFVVPFSPNSPVARIGDENPFQDPPRRRNEGEQLRLQGLMRSDTTTRGIDNQTKPLSRWGVWQVWMVNEGSFNFFRNHVIFDRQGLRRSASMWRQVLDVSSSSYGYCFTLSYSVSGL